LEIIWEYTKEIMGFGGGGGEGGFRFVWNVIKLMIIKLKLKIN
jgi:hypothetical protein